jgi:acetolactate synthase-1/2/3 large subunit
MSVDEVKSVLNTVIFNLTTGRLGPVWLSVPLDIQGSLIDDDIPGFYVDTVKPKIDLNNIYELLKNSKRPVIIAGNGINIGNCREKFTSFVNNVGIPVTTTWLSGDTIECGSPYYVGKAGIYANRAGNFAIQNSDVLLVLGCRLSQTIVGYNPKTFARESKIIYVDIDPNELMKQSAPYTITLLSDLNVFFDSFSSELPSYSGWVEKCNHWKKKWLLESPPGMLDTEVINPYHAINRLFDKLPENKIVVTAAGTVSLMVTQLLNLKKNDRFLVCGQGDMGPDLPMSIGAYIADPSKQVVLFTGDGTFQFNIQELQTIIHHKLPIKTIIFNNSGYAAIEITQRTFFNAKFGVDVGSGISFPDTSKIANAYGIKYISVCENTNLDCAIDDFIKEEGSVIFEIFCCLQNRYPKLSSRKNVDGSFTSLPLEDMEPFLDREEFLSEMIVKPI